MEYEKQIGTIKIPQNCSVEIAVGCAQIIAEKMAKAANIARQFARQHARSGTLAKSITYKQSRPRDNFVWFGVGVNARTSATYKKQTVRPVYYAHLVEGGFSHFSGKKIPPKSFLTPAVKAAFADGDVKIADAVEQITNKILKDAQNLS